MAVNDPAEKASVARYIMIGGFLGAGKTTAVLRLARHLRDGGQRVGLITNDQSFGLVDTAVLSSQGFDVEEITGGCFCCRFNSLVDAADRLSLEARPDVFLAEPVGSCTDLRATVTYPLRRLYGDSYSVAPLTVLLDPIRAERILGLEPGRAFSPKVLYVYLKQLEEAEAILINKADLLTPEREERLREALRQRFPRARVLTVSAREGTGLEPWFEFVTTTAADVPPPELDYALYGEGEALLGWFNATVRLESEEEFDGNRYLGSLAGHIGGRLADEGLEIAHLKMTLVPDEDGGDIGVLNLVRNDGQPELSYTLREPLDRGELLLNLRAEGDPERLREAVDAAFQSGGVSATVVHSEHFRPSQPVPTHRLIEV
jgi:Ni2+-binding GTPase involved in maturation of urease and hydrogenase